MAKEKIRHIDNVPAFVKRNCEVQYLTVVDWFEVMLWGWTYTDFKDEYNFGRRVRIIKDTYLKTRSFRHCYKVFLDGKEFARLFCGANEGSVIDPTFIQMKLLNHILYENDWIQRFDEILECTGWKYKNTTKLDLAIDGYGFLKPVADYMSFTKDTLDWCKVGRAGITPHAIDRGDYTGFDFGNLKKGGQKKERKSKPRKHITIYNKTAEIQGSLKTYIRERWLLHGLVYEGSEDLAPVERFELKLTNDGIKAIADYDYHLLNDPAFIGSVIRTSCRKFCHFIVKDNANVSRCTQVEFIDWSKLSAGLLPKWSAQPANEVWATKISVKKNTYSYFSTRQPFYLQAAYDLADNINCLGWFHEKVDFWYKDFRERKKEGKLGMFSNFICHREGAQVGLVFENITPKNETAYNTIRAIADL